MKIYTPKQYKVIAAYGRYMGSFKYYIQDQQELAAQDQAPIDATYKKDDGQWACLAEYPEETIKAITQHL